jgi:RNA polymerase sigma factor (TIGR02999 family)
MNQESDITVMLEAARGGDRSALDHVLSTLYRELHAMARRQLHGQRGGTLDTTALVHESYFKLIRSQNAEFADRAHFFAYAATAMRSVVVDYARQRLSQKRGGDQQRVTDLPDDITAGVNLGEEMLHLDTALQKLAQLDKRLAQVVELRYFAGLSETQIGELLHCSERTVRRDWQKARLFLLAELQPDP